MSEAVAATADVLIASVLGLLGYAYVVYPLFVAILSRLKRPSAQERAISLPSVSLLVIARDEMAAIEAKIRNCLSLDYPGERLEIVVVSDGSTDGTDEVVRALEPLGVRLVALPGDTGKTAAAWAGATASSGDVLVFSDATSLFEPGALSALVSAVCQPGVGAATGRVVYRFGREAVSAGFRDYQRYNVVQRRADARVGTAVVVSGTIHAARREVLREVPNELSYDLALPLLAAEQGLRTVYVDEAVAVEQSRRRVASELRARVRIGVRCFRFLPFLLGRARRVRLRTYLFQIASHKVARWLGAPALLLLALATAAGAATGPAGPSALVVAAALGQAALYGAALAGAVVGRIGSRIPGLGLPLFFVTVNAAYVVALVQVLSGRRVTGWTPERGEP